MKPVLAGLLVWFTLATPAWAEVTNVTILSRAGVANGQVFGTAGPYEKIVGRITVALDPSHPRNRAIVDLELAPRGPDGRVHVTADLHVLQPVDPARGNGVLLFEVANRGNKLVPGRFALRPADGGSAPGGEIGDGFLLGRGFTLVWVGWQFDVPPPGLRVEAPAVLLTSADTVRISFVVNERDTEAAPAGLPPYQPHAASDAARTLTVRDRFWGPATSVPASRWRLVTANGQVRVQFDDGFQPGLFYELTYESADARVAGVGFAAIRDAASAFVHRTDLVVRGRAAYIMGISQSGRFLRQFLTEGFNVDERGRRVFDLVWPHIAGAGLGSFNEPLAKPGYSSFPATRAPFTDVATSSLAGPVAGLLTGYGPAHQPKVVYTDTAVEYWGQGRAAALTHTTEDGRADVALPENVRRYLISSTQHGESGFPPPSGGPTRALPNPVAQAEVMRALLVAAHEWVARGVAPPASRYPRLADGTLVPLASLRFPAVPGAGDPRTAEGPARIVDGRVVALPFLVPAVDADGNDIAGIRVPDVAVPLATTTGWNFRSARAGNPSALFPLVGSYLPFSRTRAAAASPGDPRRSIEERYPNRSTYLDRIRAAAADLVSARLLLAEDVNNVVQRAMRHWAYATGTE
jgi:hypothetical protein